MNQDSTFRTERTLPFAPETVYNAFASANSLSTWWGPDGFTNEFERFDFKVGGRWTFVMVGPDGARYPNQNVFTELVPASRVVIRHDDAHVAQAVKERVVPANEQNLDRLVRVLSTITDN